ncbi:hypothetical protein [Anatilimnocola aggregata]|uniref:hypothetical protein n=1 Tax=Anatilimnocola aggregata TaxID=2528021 RepID=UPI00192E5EE1|nr:hypothetical protein [Anatilimnocola aggregata]
MNCHNRPADKVPRGVVVDGGPLDLDEFDSFKAAIDNGSMPLKANLSAPPGRSKS